MNSNARTILSLSSLLVALLIPAGAAQAKTSLLYYGDSLARESQPFFLQAANQTGKVTVTAHSFPGTAPCDFYKQMQKDVKAKPGSLVVVSFFGNVLTRCVKQASARFKGSWYNTYQQQLTQMLDSLKGASRIWIAVAPTARGSVGVTRKKQARDVSLQVAAGKSNVTVFDAGAAVEDQAGKYSLWLPCLVGEPCNNPAKPGYNQVRSNDGLHFCPGTRTNYFLNCSEYASGAFRYGNALFHPIAAYIQ